MTNRERIEQVIKEKFPRLELYWESYGAKVWKDKDGNEIKREKAYANGLGIYLPNKSRAGSINWLDAVYVEDAVTQQPVAWEDNVVEKFKELKQLDCELRIRTQGHSHLSEEQWDWLIEQLKDVAS